MSEEKKAVEIKPDVTEAVQAALARRIDGFEAVVSCDRLSGGASQETYRIVIRTRDGEQKLAMRRAPAGIPKPAVDGGPGLAMEAKLMQLAREAGVPEPEVLFVAEPEDGLGEAFVMEWLDGETLGARIVRSEELAGIRPHLAYQCGRILAKIHAIDLKKTGLDKMLHTMDPEAMVEQTWNNYKYLNTPQPMIDFAGRWLMENLPKNTRTTLVHNDFRNGNIMVSKEGVIAVLDWELPHIGDPMRDLGWICTNSWRFGNSELPVGGFGRYEDLFRGYEEVSGIEVDPYHVKFWEVFGSFWWAVGCLLMAEHYRSGPDKTVERPAIGRRSSECQVDCVNLLIPGGVTLVEPAKTPTSTEMPRIEELVVSVRDFLRDDIMAQTKGRTNFMARVASNSLDIVLRDLTLGPTHRKRELERLRRLLSTDGDLDSLRWKLVNGLREKTIQLDQPGLSEHLRESVVNQIAIDQPRYSGFKTALKISADAPRRHP
ncbi:MAG: phosphotransferase family protein [Desulfobacterales bacterium]